MANIHRFAHFIGNYEDAIGLRIILLLQPTTVILLSTVNARGIVIGFITSAPGLKYKRSWNSESMDGCIV
jgi:hypothetical protein